MKKVGYVYDPVYLRHDTGHHVENAHRLEAIISRLEETGLISRLTLIKPRPATIEELTRVHDASHVAYIKEVAHQGGGWLDPDTVVSSGSYEAALFAAGGAIEAVSAVVRGEVDSAFALVRPPGHHATTGQAMGFCLFNNIAVAARHALSGVGLKRLAIIDFDVHHGNGTQDAFYHNSRVLYISTHQYPYYPGTGAIGETGTGPAAGTTVNIPLPAGCGDGEYGQVFERIIAPAVQRFGPQLILVSAGYDAHWKDALAGMQVTVTGFARMAGVIRGLAEELCRGRLVFCLEGGYDSGALAASVKATFDALLGEAEIDDPLGPPPKINPPPDIAPLIAEIIKTYGLD